MISKIVSIIILILAAVLIVFLARKDSDSAEIGNPDMNLSKADVNVVLPDITLPFSNSPKDVAWAAFQKYLSYNKARNLEGVRNAVYKMAPVCEDPKQRVDCETRMGAAYAYGSQLKKEDFTHVWSDEKQIILSSDFKVTEDDGVIGRRKSVIFFVKDESGNLKMLSFSPQKGALISKGATPRQELEDRILRYTEDKDEDGIADYDEECLAVKEGQTCAKTSPGIRDTDGDGLWDGTQALMK